MSRPERFLRAWLYATGAVYAAGAVDYAARPHAAGISLSQAGVRLGDEPMQLEEPPGMYNALASAYMATIAALSLSAAAEPAGRRALIPPLLVAKATSTGAFLHRFARTRRVGFALAAGLDALLLGVTAGLYAALDR